MSETISPTPELQNAQQQFVDALAQKAPGYKEGNIVTLAEDVRLQRAPYEPYYSCTVTPEDDISLPPKVMLFHGMSAIAHERQIFRYSRESGRYWVTHVEAEPVMETVPPDEFQHETRPATALELGKVLGILEFLTTQPVDHNEFSRDIRARMLGRMTRSLSH